VPLEFIQRIFDVMKRAHWHQFQVLTKRAERMLELDSHLEWPENVWMGVSVENSDYTYRIDLLRQTGAVIKFISAEPLLGPLPNLNLEGIHWVIVGGESGPHARPIRAEWVREIRDQCVRAAIPFFFVTIQPSTRNRGVTANERFLRVKQSPKAWFFLFNTRLLRAKNALAMTA
jgi:protein gp37